MIKTFNNLFWGRGREYDFLTSEIIFSPRQNKSSIFITDYEIVGFVKLVEVVYIRMFKKFYIVNLVIISEPNGREQSIV